MVFLTHDLCGFHRNRFVRQLWRHVADSKLLDFSQASDSMILRINRTLCVMCYIWCVRIINPQNMQCRSRFNWLTAATVL